MKPIDVLRDFPVRKSRKQKQAFRETVCAFGEQLGYACAVEKGRFGVHNLVLGDPEKAKYLITAHYDTCARLPVPNLLTPCSFWPFLGYQIFLCAFMLAVPLAPWLVVKVVTDSFGYAWIAWYLCFWVELFLLFCGPANRTNANDNTSGVVTVLEIAATLPENLRDRVCFVLFDLEELGMLGSGAYASAHKQAVKGQLVLNLDCVGEGDHIRLFPTKKLKKDLRKLKPLHSICGDLGKKNIQIREKGFAAFPSDQMSFPYGVGICALNQSKVGLYLSRIHTGRDTILEQTNVNILRAALITLIGRSAVQ